MDLITLAQQIDGLPVHVLFLIGIIVLYRENKILHDKLEQIKAGQLATRDMLIDQNVQMARITDQTAPTTITKRYPPENRS